jgi:hypothetical protein
VDQEVGGSTPPSCTIQDIDSKGIYLRDLVRQDRRFCKVTTEEQRGDALFDAIGQITAMRQGLTRAALKQHAVAKLDAAAARR